MFQFLGLEKIVGRTIKECNAFPKLEEDVTMDKIASSLGLDVNEVIGNWAPKGVFKGFTSKFIEYHAWKFVEAEKWDAFYSVLTLLIHGMALFPNIDHFVDHLAVKIFLSRNQVPFLLVDVYHTLHT